MSADLTHGGTAHRRVADSHLLGGFLSELPDRARDRLLAGANRSTVAAGTTVFEGDERARVIVVERGLLRVFLSSIDGRQVTARYIRSGDVAGLPLVVGGPGPMSAQAMTSAVTASLRADTLRELLATDPAVARACASELARELYQTFDELYGQAFLSIRQRVALHLLNLADPTRRPPLVVHAAHEDLGEAVATSREVVTRNLHRLRDDGLVSLSRDEITILDPLGLAREVHAPEGQRLARRYRLRGRARAGPSARDGA